MSLKYNISPKYSFLKEAILDVKKNFRSTGESIKSGRNHLKIIDLDDKKFVVKSFKKSTALKSYTYGNIFPSKAKRSFDYANILLSKGIHTPEPVGYIEHYTGLQFQESFYISEYYSSDYDLSVLFTERGDNKTPFKDSETLWTAFMKFTLELHHQGIDHLDYTRRNVLITKQDSKYSFSLVDLNRIDFKSLSLRDRMKSLSRITSDSDLVKMIAKYYSAVSDYDYDKCLHLLQYFVRQNQRYWDTKKRLKRMLK
tara:strand:- start:49 stop:813 length:765 start_codon:yes stop_codon:yes gene_type:complete